MGYLQLYASAMADKKTIETGSVVQLRSGGHPMTVDVAAGSEIACVWHDESGVPHRETYNRELLTVVTSSHVNPTRRALPPNFVP